MEYMLIIQMMFGKFISILDTIAVGDWSLLQVLLSCIAAGMICNVIINASNSAAAGKNTNRKGGGK